MINKLKNKKVLMFDVDGTIAESCKVIDLQMCRLLQRLSKRYELAFITGSSVTNIEFQIRPLLSRVDKLWLLSCSGANIIFKKGTRYVNLINSEFNDSEKLEIIKALFSLTEKFNIIPLTSVKDQILDRSSQLTLSCLGRNANSKVKELYDPNNKLRERYVRYLKKIIPKYNVRIGGSTSVDITKDGQDKGKGVHLFKKFSKCKFSDIFFFGDKLKKGGNDEPVKRYVDSYEVKSIEEMKQILIKLNEVENDRRKN